MIYSLTPTCIYRTLCSRDCSTNTFVADQLIHSIIHKDTDRLWKYLQNTVSPKPQELRGWTFKRMFTPHTVSHVTCQMSPVILHVSYVTCHMSCVMLFFYFFYKVVELVGWGSVINRATPSSFFHILSYLPRPGYNSQVTMQEGHYSEYNPAVALTSGKSVDGLIQLCAVQCCVVVQLCVV